MSVPQPAQLSIRAGTLADVEAVRALYAAASRANGGLARYPEEVTSDYVRTFITRSIADGVIVVAVTADNEVVGELHCYRNGLRRFAHVIGALTVAVHPSVQGQGVGRQLFDALIHEVQYNRLDVLRIELITQESNTRAQRLYASVGFQAEGRLVDAILNTQTGLMESDIPMAWLRNRPAATKLDARFKPNQLI
ncbi:MAG: GNAT family N-acetyltransferase [Gemmatimonadaceae bacterium]